MCMISTYVCTYVSVYVLTAYVCEDMPIYGHVRTVCPSLLNCVYCMYTLCNMY